MKSKKILLLSATAMLALTGCNGNKKVEFSEYKSAVAELVKSEDYGKEPKTMKIKGSIKSEDETLEVKGLKISEDMTKEDTDKLSVGEAKFLVAYAVVASMLKPQTFATVESEDMTYYIGNGFKVKADSEEIKGVVSWDKYGALTKAKVESEDLTCNFTVSYKY